MRNAASNLMSLTLELGGNDAAIIFPDVDPKSLAPYVSKSIFSLLWPNADIYTVVLECLGRYSGAVFTTPARSVLP